MKKAEFLALLRQKLNQLPPRDVEETLEYYNEMIDDYIESGYSPDAAVAKMGNVDDIAAQILAGAQNPVLGGEQLQGEKKNGLVIAFLILGFPLWFPLLITAFSLLLTLFIVVATVGIIVPWTLVISFGASAVVLLAVIPILFMGEGIASVILSLGSSFVLAALCIFCLWIALRLTILCVKGIAAMFRGSFKLFFGRR